MLTAMGPAAYGVNEAMTDTTDEAQKLRQELEAERAGRREAERVAAENARLLYERQDELELLEMVAESSNEATEIEPALGAAIVYVCAHMRWPVGHAYLADPVTGALRPTGVWYLEEEARFEAFRDASEVEGSPALPRSVTEAGEPAWVADVASEPGFGRSDVAVAAGLRSGFAFPILTGARTVGVLEFFADRLTEPDPALLSVMGQIGVQLGRVIERVRARTELERSNADLEAFAYMASHDLAEPLRSVSGFVSLLERRYGEVLDDQARELIGYAVDGVERMRTMIDDLLLYARAGTSALECARVPAADVVADALLDLEPAVIETGADIEVDELPVISVDRGQMRRVFQNLLGNAIKYTAPGERPRVRIRGRTGAAVSELTVADNGIGLDPAEAERAFEMFVRLAGSAEPYRGSGLGLAISRRIVERHGGRLWVEPNAEGGSVFRLTLPLP
jgi:signal transduction histidine kinase